VSLVNTIKGSYGHNGILNRLKVLYAVVDLQGVASVFWMLVDFTNEGVKLIENPQLVNGLSLNSQIKSGHFVFVFAGRMG
jgi:hypothetical protein